MLARPTRSVPSLDLVSMSEVITAIAFRNGSYSSIGSCAGSFHLTSGGVYGGCRGIREE